MNDDLKLWIDVILTTVGMIVGITVVVLALYAWTGQISCDSLASLNPEMQIRWTFWNGCILRTPEGLWLPFNQARDIISPILQGR